MQEWVCRQQVGRIGSNFFPNLEKDVCGRHRGYFWKDIVNFIQSLRFTWWAKHGQSKSLRPLCLVVLGYTNRIFMSIPHKGFLQETSIRKKENRNLGDLSSKCATCLPKVNDLVDMDRRQALWRLPWAGLVLL